MEQIWEKLYNEAMLVINPHEVSNFMWVGSVASAILTKQGNIYTGICIDTNGSLGMCAERNALSTMLTHGESEVDKVISVYNKCIMNSLQAPHDGITLPSKACQMQK